MCVCVCVCFVAILARMHRDIECTIFFDHYFFFFCTMHAALCFAYAIWVSKNTNNNNRILMKNLFSLILKQCDYLYDCDKYLLNKIIFAIILVRVNIWMACNLAQYFSFHSLFRRKDP